MSELIIRYTTERNEGIEAGIARMVGITADSIAANAFHLLRDPTELAAKAAKSNPYEDGKPSERIVRR
jgi:UDP-N-acetylglucosamine 2-epimerase (non-hydrolysing)